MSINLGPVSGDSLWLLLTWIAVMALIIVAVARSPEGRKLMMQFLEPDARSSERGPQPPQEQRKDADENNQGHRLLD